MEMPIQSYPSPTHTEAPMTITKEIIVEKLASNPKWLIAGIVAI